MIFQRLIYKAVPYTQLMWLHGEARYVPQGAVIGSHTRDGAPLYIIRVEGHAGQYDARNSFAEYEYYGANSATHFQFQFRLYFCNV